jgi:hypothetical protein
MIIFNIFFIAYPITKPKNPPIPTEVASPPIPIEVAKELKSRNIFRSYPRTMDIYNIDIFNGIF